MHIEQQESINLCKIIVAKKYIHTIALKSVWTSVLKRCNRGVRGWHTRFWSLWIYVDVMVWSCWSEKAYEISYHLVRGFSFFPSLKVWFMRVSFLNDTACSVPDEVSCQVALCILAVIDANWCQVSLCYGHLWSVCITLVQSDSKLPRPIWHDSPSRSCWLPGGKLRQRFCVNNEMNPVAAGCMLKTLTREDDDTLGFIYIYIIEFI